MKKDSATGGVKPSFILTTTIIGVIVTGIFVILFALAMYFFEKMFIYAPIFATVSVSGGAFAAAFYAAKKVGKKGFFVGLIVGAVTFVAVTLISLIVDDGGFSQNTAFHFIIIMLASLIGAVLGVNKSGKKKYI